tara:strand:- start:1807 stop:2163 length:357 start_codon:yes stop_codon:yes gene_type:complete
MDNYTNNIISTYVNNLSIKSYDRQIITNCLVHLLDNCSIEDKKQFLKMLNYSSIHDDKSEEFRNSMWKTHNILKTVNIKESVYYRDESPERELINSNIEYLKMPILILLIYVYIMSLI